jgi:hypothetical protein
MSESAEAVAEAVEAPAPSEVQEPVVDSDPGDEHQPPVQQFDPSRLEDEIDAIVQARLSQILQPQQSAPGATPGPMSGQYGPQGFDWAQVDPYSEEFGSQLGQGIQSTIQQALQGALGPITGALEQAQNEQLLAEGEEALKDMIADEVARNGDFATTTRPDGSSFQPGREMARTLTDTFMPEALQRYGNHPRAAEYAVAKASAYVREWESAVKQAGAVQAANHAATLAGAPAEPGASGIASVMQGETQKYASAQSVASDLLSKYAA